MKFPLKLTTRVAGAPFEVGAYPILKVLIQLPTESAPVRSSVSVVPSFSTLRSPLMVDAVSNLGKKPRAPEPVGTQSFSETNV